jgi:DNA polymerase-3 subunit epsilon
MTTRDTIDLFWDTESTGLNVRSDHIISLSAVWGLDDDNVHEFHMLVDPGMAIPPDATRIHHITDSMVRGKPTCKQVIQKFSDWIEDARARTGAEKVNLISHNGADYDDLLLNNECRANDVRLPSFVTRFDSLAAFRAVIPYKRSLALGKLYKDTFKMDFKAHDSLEDSRALGRLWNHYISQEGISDLKMYYYGRMPYIAPNPAMYCSYDDLPPERQRRYNVTFTTPD